MKQILLLFLIFAFPNALAKGKEQTIKYYSAPMVSAENGIYRYVNSSVSFRIKQNNKVEAFFGHSWAGGEMCGNNEWRCIRIPFMFNFAINRTWKVLPDEWEYDSFQYQNVGLDKISIFGREVDVYLVCSSGGGGASKSPTRDACFNYSFKYGLLALYLYDDGFDGETVTAYYSVSEIGLFAR